VRRSIELGIDGGVPFGRDDPRVTRLTIAGQRGDASGDQIGLRAGLSLYAR
jgi:hypothetical protein